MLKFLLSKHNNKTHNFPKQELEHASSFKPKYIHFLIYMCSITYENAFSFHFLSIRVPHTHVLSCFVVTLDFLSIFSHDNDEVDRNLSSVCVYACATLLTYTRKEEECFWSNIYASLTYNI